MNDEMNTAPKGDEENTDATPATDAPATDGDNADAGTDTDTDATPATDAPATDGDNADAGSDDASAKTEEAATEAAPEAPATEEKSDSEENAV